ncbi:hypothetical protein OH77DRAFT_1538515 [Trametes cingulata]|nr:hypothetical protein OH77DRAFT_1538515 [Trametes cingulata]
MYSEDTFLDPQLEQLFEYAGEERILAFRREVCEDSDLYRIAPDFYDLDNRHNWVEKTAFKAWLARRLQVERVAQLRASQCAPHTPSGSHNVGAGASTVTVRTPQTKRMTVLTDAAGASSPTHGAVSPQSCSIQAASAWSSFKSKLQNPLPTPHIDRSPSSSSDEDSDVEATPTRCVGKGKGRATHRASNSATATTLAKRKRDLSDSGQLEDSSGQLPVSATTNRSTTKRARKTHHSTQTEDNNTWIYITRQTRVRKLITLTEVPRCWHVPLPDEDTAYLLDLSNDPEDKWMRKGEPMSMAAIIKAEDQDAWGGGSSGSKQKTVKVQALSNDKNSPVECQQADHICQGIYRCEYLDPSILDHCARYVPDPEEVRELAEAERLQNVAQTSSEEAEATMFYNFAQASKCKFKNADGEQCAGRPVLRKAAKQSPDGKYYFVGCSGWSRSDPDDGRGHRWITIPLNINEQLILELFQTRGEFKTRLHEADCAIAGNKCTHMVPRRSGGKGEQTCPHSHIIDGKVMRGKLLKHQCKTRLQIWYPVDRSDRRAIVKLDGAHTHPTPRFTKVSTESKKRLAASVEAVAASTRMIFDGKEPYEFDPALANTRQRSLIIQSVKKQKMPEGTGLDGVLKRFLDEQNRPLKDRYIHAFDVKDGVPVIVTLLPELAKRIHDAKATLHDNTYKRVAGKDWKEWEVVIWLEDIDMRITVARVYCTRERREDFARIWTLFFNAVDHATGAHVSFKAFCPDTQGAARGIRAIVVDGCQAQIDGLGDFLIERIKTEGQQCAVTEDDPQKIVEYVLKICSVHFDRNLTELSHKCSAEIMARVREFPNLATYAELDEFASFCETSPNKALRDWWANKKGMPWFAAGINRNFSRMSPADWQSTPSNTNINESAHTLTNAHTRTGLSILEAVISAEEFDRHQAARIRVTEDTGVRANVNNTPSKRLKRNAARAESRRAKAAERRGATAEADKLKPGQLGVVIKKATRAHGGKGKYNTLASLADSTVIPGTLNPGASSLIDFYADSPPATSSHSSGSLSHSQLYSSMPTLPQPRSTATSITQAANSHYNASTSLARSSDVTYHGSGAGPSNMCVPSRYTTTRTSGHDVAAWYTHAGSGQFQLDTSIQAGSVMHETSAAYTGHAAAAADAVWQEYLYPNTVPEQESLYAGSYVSNHMYY